MNKKRILLNDFGGYPFPVQLSRELSKSGFVVMHCFLSNINTPHGNMERDKLDNEELIFSPVMLNSEFKKYSFTGRLKGELEYARKVSDLIDSFKPDIFLSANTPLLAQANLQQKCARDKIKFVYWCQDIHSIALKSFFRKKLPILGGFVANYFERKEVNLLKRSDWVITISEDFNTILVNWGLTIKKIATIYNWAPINEITLFPKSNEWSKIHNLDEKFVVLYSGTLGLKHNPSLILNAAIKQKENKDFVFLVVSEGLGADYLKKGAHDHKLTNLVVLPFQNYLDLPMVLGTADVLLSVLEPDAALYSVPSKVLTYLCARRPIIVSVPKENLAARIVDKYEAGYSIEPGNTQEFLEKLETLFSQEELRLRMGENGRNYAESNFNIKLIAEKFATVFQNVHNVENNLNI